MSVTGLLGSIKIVLISLGIVMIAIAMNSSLVPWLREFATSRLPALRSMVLFIVLNGIILLLAASAKLFDQDAAVLVSPTPAMPAAGPAADSGEEEDMRTEVVEGDYEEKHVVVVEGDSNSEFCRDGGSLEAVADHGLGEVRLMERPPVMVQLTEKFVEDNPLVSPRLVHEKSVIDNDEGDTRALTLRASKSQRDSSPESHTMDSVWRAITSEKAEIDDQFKTQENDISSLSPQGQPKLMKESDMIRCRTNHRKAELPALPPIRPRKEPSLDKLNRQVEDFISKFKEDMRLQRDESLRELHLKGSISPGA